MAAGQGGDADHVGIAVAHVDGCLGGGLEEFAGPHLEAEVGESVGDHLGAPVVAVLAHLDDQNAGRAPFEFGENLDLVGDPPVVLTVLVGIRIDAAGHLRHRMMAAPDLFQSAGDLAHRGPAPGCLDAQLQQVAGAVRCGLGQLVEGAAGGRLVAPFAYLVQEPDLAVTHPGIVHLEHVHLRVVLLRDVFVHADDHFLAPLDARLAPGGGSLRYAAWACRR